MSVIRIYPVKDTFIVGGDLKDVNAGLDEILELGLCKGEVMDQGVARILMGFDWTQIPATASSVTLHLATSTISNLKENTTVQLFDQTVSWDRGTGHLYDVPNPSDGATWNYPTTSTTASWSGSIASGSVPVCEYSVKGNDLDIDITNYYSTLHSIVLKLKDEEVNTRLSYFSTNTHTIYRPYLEVLVDDSVRGEDIPEEINVSRVLLSAKGSKESYVHGNKIRFNLGVRPLYPARTFSTSSLYLENYTLPSESYWSIKDEYTNECVIGSSIGTKLSADSTGNFFVLDTGLLEPERYYRLFVCTDLKGQHLTLDSKAVFKIEHV